MLSTTGSLVPSFLTSQASCWYARRPLRTVRITGFSPVPVGLSMNKSCTRSCFNSAWPYPVISSASAFANSTRPRSSTVMRPFIMLLMTLSRKLSSYWSSANRRLFSSIVPSWTASVSTDTKSTRDKDAALNPSVTPDHSQQGNAVARRAAEPVLDGSRFAAHLRHAQDAVLARLAPLRRPALDERDDDVGAHGGIAKQRRPARIADRVHLGVADQDRLVHLHRLAQESVENTQSPLAPGRARALPGCRETRRD